MPVVTTLHTVLKEPTPEQAERDRRDRPALGQAGRDESVERPASCVTSIEVPEEKIAFVHHGIPDLPFVDPNYYKDRFGVEDRTVAATFGLLSPNKGIEHMIAALPEIVKSHPEFMYLVLGRDAP